MRFRAYFHDTAHDTAATMQMPEPMGLYPRRACDLCKRGAVQGYGVPIHFTKTGATLHLLCAIYAAQKAKLN